jgi:mannose-6-phosphate isomerase-like protein (cupin superfamily)
MSYVLVNCVAFQPIFDFFTKSLFFKVKSIFPADNPSTAVLIGYTLTLKLMCNGEMDNTTFHIVCDDITQFVDIDGASVVNDGLSFSLPNGTQVVLMQSNGDINIPPLKEALVINLNSPGIDKRNAKGVWTVGRAGMRYRDLIPCRLGGRYIASHIHIPNEGPVPDYVHYHKVRFQVIFCYKGWVRVVYEDQGDPFVLRAGDCVVQPPQIRHRVLECGPDLEVVEIGCPAIHETLAEFDIALPTAQFSPERLFDGRRFVRHVHDSCPWTPASGWTDSTGSGWEAKCTGIGAATQVGEVMMLRPMTMAAEGTFVTERPVRHDGEFFFVFVLSGKCECVTGDSDDEASASADASARTTSLASTDAVTIPAGLAFSFRCCSEDLQLLVVTSPPDMVLTPASAIIL